MIWLPGAMVARSASIAGCTVPEGCRFESCGGHLPFSFVFYGSNTLLKVTWFVSQQRYTSLKVKPIDCVLTQRALILFCLRENLWVLGGIQKE